MLLGGRASKKYFAPNAWYKQFYSLVTTKIDEEISKPLFSKVRRTIVQICILRILVALRIVREVISLCADNSQEQAWYKQILARYKFFISEIDSIHIQKTAFENNCRLLYPQNGIDYKKMEFKSGEQLANIQCWLKKFNGYKEMRIKSMAVLDNLSFGRASNLFEEALREVGEMLGFKSQRPDNEYKVGPDNLWCGVHNQYLFFE